MATNRHILSLFKSNESSPFRTCQWPFGDPRTTEFHFCGKEALDGKSYCADHYARAYITVPARDSKVAAA